MVSPILIAVISIILIIVVVHLVVMFLLPRMKTIFMGLTRDEKIANAMLVALFFIIIVYGLSAIIPLIESLGSNPSLYIGILKTPIQTVLNFVPVVQWILVGAVVAFGLK